MTAVSEQVRPEAPPRSIDYALPVLVGTLAAGTRVTRAGIPVVAVHRDMRA